MTLQYLVKRRRRFASKVVKKVNPEFIKDAVIFQLQSLPLYGEEIVDIDIPTTTEITIYLRKGKSRTGKD